jgi:hypothetical protein
VRRHWAIVAAALLSAGPLAATGRAQTDPGGGAEVGGTVPSFFSLGLEQTATSVVATITSTDAPVSLSVAADGAGRFDASLGSGRYNPLDPTFGLVLQRWDDVLAGRKATFRLRATSAAPSVVLVTVAAQTP